MYNVRSTKYHVLSTQYQVQSTMYPTFGRQARSLRSTIWVRTRIPTLYFVLGTWYSPRIPTSSFFNQRSIFDIKKKRETRCKNRDKFQYQVASIKQQDKFGWPTNSHVFILQSEFNIRHKKEARDKKQEPRWRSTEPRNKMNAAPGYQKLPSSRI